MGYAASRSERLVLQPNYLQYESDQVLFKAGDGLLRQEIKIWSLVRSALRDFDIVHFNFGRPLIYYMPGERRVWPPSQAAKTLLGRPYRALFEFADVALFKRAGKGIAVTYQGSDARQVDYCLDNYEITAATEMERTDYDTARDNHKRRQIAKFSRYADRIYALTPNLLSVLPRAEFLPCAHMDPRQWRPVYSKPRTRPRVLHAPTNRAIKGTRFILEAVERLRRDGVPFDFELVEKLPHTEARRRYREADLVVDQLLGGWYGGFAVEVMALGKPVIAYLRQSDLHVLPKGMRADLPIINATPATIYDVLKEWLTARRSALPEQGRAGRAYVERWHDARAIAERLVADYVAILRGQTPRSR